MYWRDEDWQYATGVKDRVSRAWAILIGALRAAMLGTRPGQKDGADKKRRDERFSFLMLSDQPKWSSDWIEWRLEVLFQVSTIPYCVCVCGCVCMCRLRWCKELIWACDAKDTSKCSSSSKPKMYWCIMLHLICLYRNKRNAKRWTLVGIAIYLLYVRYEDTCSRKKSVWWCCW